MNSQPHCSPRHTGTLRSVICVVLLMTGGLAKAADPLRVAFFEVDASPRIGAPLAYDTCIEITDPLSCRGLVIMGQGPPVVLCVVDWIGVANEAHRVWRQKLADAAGTTPDRVAVHAIHQHDAPRCDLSAAALLAEVGKEGEHYDVPWIRDVISRSAVALGEAMRNAQTVDEVGLGTAEVFQVASNRRILGDDGTVVATRFTACADPELRAMPVGTVDPLLRSVSLWNDGRPVVVLTYFATHPQSYYRTGQANPDFPGYARNARHSATGVPHVHFNGAGGNIGAGKWNDGSHENRAILTDRVADGMRRAFEATERHPIDASDLNWATETVMLPVAPHLDENQLMAQLTSADTPPANRVAAAEDLAWLRQNRAGGGTDLQCLTLGPAKILHMPGELFVEYQLAATELRPDGFVAMAAYGDYGPGYIGTEVAYGQGGYETSPRASRVAPEVEDVLMPAIARLIAE